MNKGVIHTARFVQEELTSNGQTFRAALITLTYRPDVCWKAEHVKDLLAHYRKWFQRRKYQFRYVWVMELHKSGVPHYHIVAWFPRGVVPPFPDKQGWWPHGMTESKFARSPVGYIAKYAGKGLDSPHAFPKGARIWGCGGCSENVCFQRTWALAPLWVRELSGDPKEVVRKRNVAKDGDSWWEFPQKGFRCGTPWEFDLSAGVVRWRGWTSWDIEFFPAAGADF